MNRWDQIIQEYESIQASDELKERIRKTMKQENRKQKWIKGISGAVAAFAAASVIAVNIFPGLAYAMADIPVLGPIVRVVTLGKYENNENGYHARVVTPKIEGLLDQELENKINEEFKGNASAIIGAYEEDVQKLKEEFGDETIHMGIESDYIVKTDNDKILALDVYILNIAGSSSTVHTFYNIDKKNGQLLHLPDLFTENAGYVDVISDYIKGEMKRRNQEEDGLFWIEGEDSSFEGFSKIDPDNKFYLSQDGKLMICFDKYEVAAGAQGSPEFEIPPGLIRGMLKPQFAGE